MPGPLQPVLSLPQDPSAALVVLPSEPAAHPATHHFGTLHNMCWFMLQHPNTLSTPDAARHNMTRQKTIEPIRTHYN